MRLGDFEPDGDIPREHQESALDAVRRETRREVATEIAEAIERAHDEAGLECNMSCVGLQFRVCTHLEDAELARRIGKGA